MYLASLFEAYYLLIMLEVFLYNFDLPSNPSRTVEFVVVHILLLFLDVVSLVQVLP